MSNVKPCSETNAVKIVAFAFDLVQEIDETIINNAIKLYDEDKELRTDLIRKSTHDEVSVTISDGAQVSKKSLGGVSFESLSSNGEVEWTLLLSKKSLMVSCKKYTRWDDVWAKAKTYFGKIIESLDGQTVSNATLEYLDEFIIEDITKEWKLELFNKESKFLAKNFFEVDDLWHSDHGYLVNKTSPMEHKILNTINISLLKDEKQERNILAIRTQHKSFVASDIKGPDSFFIGLDGIYQDHHNNNKSILQNMLSKAMLKKISLV